MPVTTDIQLGEVPYSIRSLPKYMIAHKPQKAQWVRDTKLENSPVDTFRSVYQPVALEIRPNRAKRKYPPCGNIPPIPLGSLPMHCNDAGKRLCNAIRTAFRVGLSSQTSAQHPADNTPRLRRQDIPL